MVTIGPNVVIDSSLVFYVDVSNPLSYPGTGSSLFDLTRNGYNFISPSSSVTFTTDARGVPCMDFANNQSTYLDSVINSPFSGNSFAISVVAVINENAVGSYRSMLSQSASNGMSFQSYNGKMGTDFFYPSGRILTSATSTNTIYMVTWTIPLWSDVHNTCNIYLNGSVKPTQSHNVAAVPSLSAAKFRIGGWVLTASYITTMPFDGQIYSMMVYNRELTATEVLQNYTALKYRFGLT